MQLFRRKYYIKEPEVVYELKPGSTYLIEYQSTAVPPETLRHAQKTLEGQGIHVVFVPNPTNYQVFAPVPATPTQPFNGEE